MLWRRLCCMHGSAIGVLIGALTPSCCQCHSMPFNATQCHSGSISRAAGPPPLPVEEMKHNFSKISWSAGTRGKNEMFWKFEGKLQKPPRARVLLLLLLLLLIIIMMMMHETMASLPSLPPSLPPSLSPFLPPSLTSDR